MKRGTLAFTRSLPSLRRGSEDKMELAARRLSQTLERARHPDEAVAGPPRPTAWTSVSPNDDAKPFEGSAAIGRSGDLRLSPCRLDRARSGQSGPFAPPNRIAAKHSAFDQRRARDQVSPVWKSIQCHGTAPLPGFHRLRLQRQCRRAFVPSPP